MNEMQEGFKLGNKATALVGKLLSPWLTRRQADADSRADIQAVLTDQVAIYVEANPTDPAVLDAIVSCGGRFGFDNLVRILQLATPQLNEGARPGLISEDWGANFRDKAHTYSDPDMASLWAQLLAGEANSPGTYSRKTVNTLADMDSADAQLFKTLCDFRLIPVQPVSPLGILEGKTTHMLERAPVSPKLVVLDDTHPIYTDKGINFNALARLEWLGLIRYVSFGYVTNHHSDKFLAYEHGGGQLYLASEQPIGFGQAEFMPAGAELSELCVPLESPEGFIDYLTETWRNLGVRVAHTLTDALRS